MPVAQDNKEGKSALHNHLTHNNDAAHNVVKVNHNMSVEKTS